MGCGSGGISSHLGKSSKARTCTASFDEGFIDGGRGSDAGDGDYYIGGGGGQE